MKKVIKLLIILIIIGIIAIGGVFMINWYVKSVTKNKIIEDYSNIDSFDAILILGCEVKPDGSLSLMLKDRMDKCIFKPEATYMGDTIPVSSNGDITNDK